MKFSELKKVVRTRERLKANATCSTKHHEPFRCTISCIYASVWWNWLSRKAMKKTLKRLKSEAEERLKEYNKTLENGKTDIYTESFRANQAVVALCRYATILEEAYSEFAEPIDKRLKIMEKAVQTADKTVEKKKEEKKRGTTYID